MQQGFIDERASLDPTTADRSRTADEGKDEDEPDDDMSEATRTKRTEKRKDSDGRNSKRVYGHRYLSLIRRTRVH